MKILHGCWLKKYGINNHEYRTSFCREEKRKDEIPRLVHIRKHLEVHLSAEKKKGRMRFQDLFTSENTSKWMLYLVYLFINLAFFRMIKY